METPGYYRGSVLLLAMLFLLMLSFVSATLMHNAMLQFQMAGNDQFYEEALQQARAIVTELAHDSKNFSMTGGVGSTSCPIGDAGLHCNSSHLKLPVSGAVAEGVDVDYRIVRQEPLLVQGFPFRESQHKASSVRNVGVAVFEVDVVVDGSELRLARAQAIQGIAVRLAGLQ